MLAAFLFCDAANDAIGTSRQYGLLCRRSVHGSKADSRNQPPPADVLQPDLAIQPPRDDAERVEPVLVRRGPCQADFPADVLPALAG